MLHTQSNYTRPSKSCQHLLSISVLKCSSSNVRMLRMDSKEFTEWLNQEVEDRGWSYRELGRRANLSSGTISRVTTRQTLPTWDFCMSVSRALQMPAEDVFRQAGLLPLLPPAVEEEQEALRILRSLPAGVRETVITMLRALARREGVAVAEVQEPADPLLRELIWEYEQATEEERPGLIAMAKLWRRRPDEGEREGERETKSTDV
jgi:transcriptional regulator with XRE-family HTH domain